MTFPLIAQAADKLTHAPKAMIQATEKRFFPKYCAEGAKRLAADVCDCYQQTKSSDPKQEECLIADFMALKTIKILNDRNIALGQSPEYNMPFFTSMEIGKRARSFMEESPIFKNYTISEFVTYLLNSFNIITDDYVKLNKKTNGDCSAFFKP